MRKNALLLILVLFALISCRRFEQQIKTETLPEAELYALGMQKYEQKEYDAAIAAFDRFERLYVNSGNIREVRLKRADAYFNKDSYTGYLSAKAEYQQFVALYPNFPREDYLWFQIANCSIQQMLPPNRDQSATETAIEDLELFLNRYSESEYVPQARELLNNAYKRLAEYHVVVADHYYGRGILNAASSRYLEAVEMSVNLENYQDILYKLVDSLAKSSIGYYYSMVGARSVEFKRQNVIDFYQEQYRTSAFNARKYFEQYSNSFANNTGRINDLRSIIDQIPEDNEPAESDTANQQQ